MRLRLVTKDDFFSHLFPENRSYQDDYLTMYSSQWQGYVSDPDLMLVPVDDHLVHRGDGVFDVMRCINGSLYQREAHLARLEDSARAVSLDLPPDYSRIREIINILIREGAEKDCIVRIVLSRGPGSFSINPFDCPSSQLYINVIRYHKPADKLYLDGIPLVTSGIPIKKSFFATIKSCNYLPNVLMKMEAVKKGCRYAVALDEEGFLAEGSTENVAVLSPDGILKFPGFEKTLAGVTAQRIHELADVLVKRKLIRKAQFAKISLEEAYLSSEMMLLGTSIKVLPVVSFDGRSIGKGRPGPVCGQLSALLQKDMMENKALLTRVPWEKDDMTGLINPEGFD
jgi:branched-subunit amino acid aminotransferase/4-amino-4-deoxychorismate lyase